MMLRNLTKRLIPYSETQYEMEIHTLHPSNAYSKAKKVAEKLGDIIEQKQSEFLGSIIRLLFPSKVAKTEIKHTSGGVKVNLTRYLLDLDIPWDFTEIIFPLNNLKKVGGSYYSLSIIVRDYWYISKISIFMLLFCISLMSIFETFWSFCLSIENLSIDILFNDLTLSIALYLFYKYFESVQIASSLAKSRDMVGNIYIKRIYTKNKFGSILHQGIAVLAALLLLKYFKILINFELPPLFFFLLFLLSIVILFLLLMIRDYKERPTLVGNVSSSSMLLSIYFSLITLVATVPAYFSLYGWESLGELAIFFKKEKYEVITRIVLFNLLQFIALMVIYLMVAWWIEDFIHKFSEERLMRYISKSKKRLTILPTFILLLCWLISAVAVWLLIFHALNFVLVVLLHQRPIFPDIFGSPDYWSHILAFVQFISSIKHQRYDMYLLINLATLMSFLPLIFLISLTAIGVGKSIVGRFRKGKEAPNRIVEIVKEASKVANIKMPEVYVVDKNVPNATSNSYGIFRLKHRITLTSKLIDVMSDEELKAAIYHEIYHLKHNTRLKNLLAFISTITLTGRGVLNAIFDFSAEEYLADEFAAKHTSPETVLNMLQKLASPDSFKMDGLRLWSKFKSKVAKSSLIEFCQFWMKELPTYRSPTIADRIENIKRLTSKSS